MLNSYNLTVSLHLKLIIHDPDTSVTDPVTFFKPDLLIFVPSIKQILTKWKQTKYGSLQEPQKD